MELEVKVEGKKYKVNTEDFPITIGNTIIGSIQSGRTGYIVKK